MAASKLATITAVVAVALVLAVFAAVVPVAVAEAITVNVEKATYMPGETLRVYGTAPAGSTVGVEIVNPKGVPVDYKQVTADATGKYEVTFKLPPTLPYANWIAGEYTVVAYLGSVTATTKFVLSAGARVTGKVVDTKGTPLKDAEVLVVETGDYATSKADGSFELYTSPGIVTVRVSKAGYVSVEKKVELKQGDNYIGTITLQSVEELVTGLSSRVSELESKIAAIDQSLAAIQETLKGISETLNKLATKDDVNKVASAVNALAGTVSAVRDDVTGLKGDLTKLRTDLLSAVDNAVSAAREAASKADAAKSSADAAKSSADAAKSSADAAKSSADTAVSEIRGVKSAVDDVKKAVADAAGSLSGIYTLVIVTLVFALISVILSAYAVMRLSRALAK